jgi:hypothetical protein
MEDETRFTELDLCDLVERTLKKQWTPAMPPEVWKALLEFASSLHQEAAKPRLARVEQMQRELEELRSRRRPGPRLGGGDDAASPA